jgi:hypothetical protein
MICARICNEGYFVWEPHCKIMAGLSRGPIVVLAHQDHHRRRGPPARVFIRRRTAGIECRELLEQVGRQIGSHTRGGEDGASPVRPSNQCDSARRRFRTRRQPLRGVDRVLTAQPRGCHLAFLDGALRTKTTRAEAVRH